MVEAPPEYSRNGVAPARLRRLWQRELEHYPDTGPRYRNLAIVVASTVVLYYELYVNGAAATLLLDDLDMSFSSFVFALAVGNFVGAFGSLFAGFTDRSGRANIVVLGLLITGLLTLFVVPNVRTGFAWGVTFAVISFVEGIILVATPALIRDFSPQVGRASAMVSGRWDRCSAVCW